LGALTKAFLDLPVGELEAAIENRPATRQDRNRTVRSVTGTDERELTAESSKARRGEGGGQAVARAVPVIRDALNKAGASETPTRSGFPRRNLLLLRRAAR
jgi:hypothetical protein